VNAICKLLASCCLLATLFCLSGCDDPQTTSGPVHGHVVAGDPRGQVFQTFASKLNQLEDYRPDQILPHLRDLLNQWQRVMKPTSKWRLDPATEDLPESFRSLPEFTQISSEEFTTEDMVFLMECVWLRDIAHNARGASQDELTIATQLFDWTIRNLQIEPETAEKGAVKDQTVGEILLLGRATAIERAWVFILLCRQQGIDACMLAIPDGNDSDKLRPWLPAVRIKNDLYLFDTELGLPVPGPDGRPVATLAEAAADDSLLRALDLDAQHPYPVKSSDLQSVVALVEASPGYLSRGLSLIEGRLAGNERVVLTASPSDSILRLKSIPHIGDAKIWEMPYEILAARRKRSPEDNLAALREIVVLRNDRPLYQGRVRQLKGAYDGPEGAKKQYLDSRPPREYVDTISIDAEKQVINEVKQAATFWLGLMAYDQKDYSVAVDYFRERVIIASPDGPWTAGARYNLGRTYEALGDTEKAIAQYQLDTSPQSVGNKLRARRLLAKP
jgi:hypothetical protein